MSTRYINQQTDSNFIYPNYDPKQYDVEIVHEINNNSVSGTVTNFTGTSVSSSSITISFDYTWALNGAEPFVRSNNTQISVMSVHIMVEGQDYFKPWRCVNSAVGAITATTQSGTASFAITPSEMGVSAFDNGTYYYEVRMIGKRAIFPICGSFVVSGIVAPTPTPTVTPTVTPTMRTPTPTPTPSTTPQVFTSGATINVTDTGWIKYTTSSGDTYQQINSLGNVVLTNCLYCNTIRPGVPFADVASFTILDCGTSCGTPSVTPTPTPTNIVYLYYKLTDCQNYQTYYSQLLPSGTFNSGDRVEGSSGYFYVVSGTYYTEPAGTSGQRYVTGTGLFSCP